MEAYDIAILFCGYWNFIVAPQNPTGMCETSNYGREGEAIQISRLNCAFLFQQYGVRVLSEQKFSSIVPVNYRYSVVINIKQNIAKQISFQCKIYFFKPKTRVL